MVGGIWRVRRSGSDKDAKTHWESFSHAPEVLGEWLPDRLRQPDYLPPGSIPKDEGRRLSALRPYLTAGLPLSVQSMLIKELAWIGNEGQTRLNIVRLRGVNSHFDRRGRFTSNYGGERWSIFYI